MASQALERQERYKTVMAMTKGRVGTLASALPSLARVNREADVRRAQRAVTVFNQMCWENNRLMSCTDATLQGSLIRVCQLGLELDPSIGHAYLVPYSDKCQLIIGYRGYVALMTRGGAISAVSAEMVCENDEFSFSYGTDEHLNHKPALTDRGEPICVYAIAHMKDGHRRFKVLSIEHVNKIRDVSLKKSSRADSPWKVYYEEMARKTALRNLAKYIPQAAEAMVEAARDEARDAGVFTVPQTFEEVESEVIDEPPRGKEDAGANG